MTLPACDFAEALQLIALVGLFVNGNLNKCIKKRFSFLLFLSLCSQ